MTQELDLFGEQPAESPFDAIRQTDGEREWWSARDLMGLLGYDRWENFTRAIEEAKISAAAEFAGEVSGLFRDAAKKSSGGRPAVDIHLTRYAAYLVAMSGDPRKIEVAAARRYFAIKTREAEVSQPRELTGRELMAKALIEAHSTIQEQEKEIAAANAQIEADRPMVAKAKAHSSNGKKLVTRTEFAREIITYCTELEPPVHVPYQQAMDFLHEINLFTKSGTDRADAGQATTWAIRERYAKTEKGIAPNGYPWATGKLTRAGQDFAWSRVVRRLNKTGSLAPVERKRGLAA